jgi:polar amino acid transport system substrate-binding protein
MLRRAFAFAFAIACAALLAACAHAPAAAPEVRQAIAPTGVLRVGVYSGSPTSFVKAKDGSEAGVALEMGRMLGRDLGVPVLVVQFDRIALVLAAMKAGDVDFTFTNATEERKPLVDFTPAIVRLELGYLVPAGSKLANADAVDSPGVRVGVTEGSSSQSTLGKRFKSAQLVPAASLDKAIEMLKAGQIDAYATNKGIFFELSDKVPGSRVLPGRWGVENLAIAYPKGREAGSAYLAAFGERLRGSAELKQMQARAGLRGAAED